jgi:hypothetical protein
VKNNAPLARILRLAVVKNLLTQGKLDREQALELLSGPLAPGDETTIFDDSAMLDLSDTESMNAIYGSER